MVFNPHLSIVSSAVEQPINYLNYLSEEEKDTFYKLEPRSRKDSYLSGRIAAKEAISCVVHSDNRRDIQISWGVFNQPIVRYRDHSNIGVTISHNKSYSVALAFYESCPFGIDVEDLTDERAEIAKTQLTKAELVYLEKNREYSAIMIWSIKEALSKVLRTGLMSDFSLYEISKISNINNCIESHFRNFPQYKALSYFVGNSILSIVLPRDLEMQFVKS